MKKDKEWLKGLINEEGTVMDMNSLGRHDGQYWKNENIKINKGRLFYLIDQLDEPQKPVIPQFVADWIESQDDPIYKMCVNYEMWGVNAFDADGATTFTGEIAEWFDDTLNVENYYRACIDGYEVEKEKLYHVVNKENYFMLRKYDGLVELHTSPSMSRDKHGKDTRFMLTEKEIKDYDERFWAFAEPV